MKEKEKNRKTMMHWAARLLIRYGTMASLLVLICGFCAERGSFMAISVCRAAVRMFAVSNIGGLLLDVTAQRTGMKQ